MKGYRFYEELEHKNRKAEASKGTVIAVPVEESGRSWKPLYTKVVNNSWCMECISAVYNEPNSPVCGSSVSNRYLRDSCKRVSEARAREIHPMLFVYLGG